MNQIFDTATHSGAAESVFKPDDQALFLHNEADHIKAREQNVNRLQTEMKGLTAEIQKEKANKLADRDRAQRLADYYTSISREDEASKYRDKVRRLDEYLHPSQAPSIQMDKPRRWHLKIFSKP